MISLAFVFLALVEMALVIIAKKIVHILTKRSKILRPIPIKPFKSPLQEPKLTPGSNNITSVDIDCERPQVWVRDKHKPKTTKMMEIIQMEQKE